MTITQPLLGRCKDCDYALFATMEDVVPVESFKDMKLVETAYSFDHAFFARCPSRHRIFVLRHIKGTFSAEHQCDARCLNARGWECTCSCGGANHGRGHAGNTRTASERVQRHLGEVGATIKGTATVSLRKALSASESTLYTFTTKTGDTIKWFAPDYADPHYEVGDEITFRAKVKKHEDNEYGKATIVTYLEAA